MGAVLVRDEIGRQIFRGAADLRETQTDLARRTTGVHEHARFGGLKVRAIASGPAAENSKFDGHEGKLKRKGEGGKRKR